MLHRITLYTDATGLGGAEISLGHVAAGIPPRFDVTVAGTTRSVVEHVAGRRPGTGTLLLPAHGPRAFLAHVAVLRRLRPDVLHVNLPVPWSNWHALAAGVLCRVPVVAVEQLPIKTRSRWERRWKRVLSRRLAAHVAVGEASARETEAYAALPAGSVRSIRNGVPDFGPVIPRPHDGVVLIGVGRLDRQKAFDVLLEALVDLPETVRVVIAGGGREHGALQAQAETLGVAERVRITGWTDGVREHLAEADVFVLPSRSEGFPLAIAEAMLAGLPVVATGVGSVPEAVRDGETGLLVPKDDPSALAAALRKLVDDAPLRERMGAQGRDVALAFTVQRMVAEYLSLWQEVAGRARR